MSNPFDFPSSFWFGWHLCFAALLIAVGFGIALDVVIPFGPALAWALPIMCWIDAAAFVGVAAHARQCQIHSRLKAKR